MCMPTNAMSFGTKKESRWEGENLRKYYTTPWLSKQGNSLETICWCVLYCWWQSHHNQPAPRGIAESWAGGLNCQLKILIKKKTKQKKTKNKKPAAHLCLKKDPPMLPSDTPPFLWFFHGSKARKCRGQGRCKYVLRAVFDAAYTVLACWDSMATCSGGWFHYLVPCVLFDPLQDFSYLRMCWKMKSPGFKLMLSEVLLPCRNSPLFFPLFSYTPNSLLPREKNSRMRKKCVLV